MRARRRVKRNNIGQGHVDSISVLHIDAHLLH